MASDSENKGSTRVKTFHGTSTDSYSHYRLRLTSCLRQKNLWYLIERSDDTDVDTGTPTNDNWTATDIIIQSLGDKPLSVVADLSGDPGAMLKALDARYRGATTTDVIILLGEMHNKTYRDHMDISIFVDELGNLFSRLKAIQSEMSDLMQVGFLLAKIPQSSAMHAAAAALRSMDPSQLTWEKATNRLVAEYKTVETKPSVERSKKKARNRKGKGGRRSAGVSEETDDEIDVASIAQAVALAIKDDAGRGRQLECSFCGRKGHTTDRCYQNPDNPSNTLPQKLRDKLLVAQSSSKPEAAPKKAKKSPGSGEQHLEVLAIARDEACTTVIPPDVSGKDARCVVDSGATVSLFHSVSAFIPGSLVPTAPRSIALADKRKMVASLAGDVMIPFEGVRLRITNSLFAPDLGYNLVSVGRLADKGIRSTFDANAVRLTMNTGMHVGLGVREDGSGLYYLPAPFEQGTAAMAMINSPHQIALNVTAMKSQLWHRRLAHIGYADLVKASEWTDGIPADLAASDMPVCGPCRKGKAHRLPFTGKFERASRVGQTIHSDMAGPLPPSYQWAYRYMATFTDDCARHTSVAFMNRKSQLRSAFVRFKLQLADLVKSSVSIDELQTYDVEDFESALGGEDGIKIIRLHSDQGKEYTSLEQTDHLATYSPTYTPQHNAIAERVNRTLFDAARTLLIDAEIPICFWPFAVSHVAYVRNRLKHSTVGDCPHTVVTGSRPNVKNLRAFGCRAFVLSQPTPAKMSPRAESGVLLACRDHGIYTVLVDGGEDQLPRLVTSRHVTFDETMFPGLEEYAEGDNVSDGDDASIADADVSSTNDSEDSECESATSESSSSSSSSWEMGTCFQDPATKHLVYECSSDADVESPQIDTEGEQSEAGDSASEKGNDDSGQAESAHGGSSDDEEEPSSGAASKYQRYPGLARTRKPTSSLWRGAFAALEVDITTSDSPTLREALSATPTEHDLWIQSIEDEFKSLEDKGTWRLVENGCDVGSALPTHTVHNVKRLAGGIFERCKTRVVAGGNHQTFGVDYFETHAPVVDFATVRFFLRLAVIMSWKRAQIDVKTAFLNGDLEEEIYVRSPHGIPGRPSHTYRLLKALYGLKQAHLAWHSRVVSDLTAAGFSELPSSPCVFVKFEHEGTLVIILIYVDDFLLLSSSHQSMEETKALLASLYELRIMEKVNLYLGVELVWSKVDDIETLTLSQPSYIESVLKRFGMENARPCPTPMIEGFYAGIDSEEDTATVEQKLYQQIVGCLLHISLRTRPDIMTAIGILSRFSAKPTEYCHKGLKRVLRYLRGTTDLGLAYHSVPGCEKPGLCVFVDSDYASDTVTRKSTSGMAMLVESGLVQWHSRRQKSSALSTCEAEYRAMTEATMDALLYSRVLEELGMPLDKSVPMHSDNEAAIKWASGERTPYKRSKHIDVAVHFIRELVRDGKISVPYVPTDKNVSDGMTKPLGKVAFARMIAMFGMTRVGNGSEEE